MYEAPPPLPQRPDRTWLKYTIGGVLVLVASLLGWFGWSQYSKAKELEQAPLTAKWETLSLPDAWIAADMPGNPQSSQGPGPADGSIKHSRSLKVGDSDWLLEWYDLGTGPATTLPLDMRVEIERFASKAQYKVDDILRMDFTGFEGRKAVMSNPEERLGRARVLRRGNRVYFMAATGLTEGNLEAGERFLSSLKLLPVQYMANTPGSPEPLALASAQQAKVTVFVDNTANVKVAFKGGVPPYTLTLNSVNLPHGLRAETADSGMVLSGVTEKDGDFSVGYTLLDQAEARLVGTIEVHVEGNPFSIVCEPAVDAEGRVVVDAAEGVKIRLRVDGPLKEIEGDGKWKEPWVPTGMASAPELDGLVITGPAWSGENAKINVEWTAKSKEGREFKCKESFRIAFKVPQPPPPPPDEAPPGGGGE
jgi:hypothetical protein